MRSYPDLKFADSEGGIGWIPFYLDRCDRHYTNQWVNDLLTGSCRARDRCWSPSWSSATVAGLTGRLSSEKQIPLFLPIPASCVPAAKQGLPGRVIREAKGTMISGESTAAPAGSARENRAKDVVAGEQSLNLKTAAVASIAGGGG